MTVTIKMKDNSVDLLVNVINFPNLAQDLQQKFDEDYEVTK